MGLWFFAFFIGWGVRLYYAHMLWAVWFLEFDLEPMLRGVSQLLLGLVFLLASLWLLAARRSALTPPELR